MPAAICTFVIRVTFSQLSFALFCRRHWPERCLLWQPGIYGILFAHLAIKLFEPISINCFQLAAIEYESA
jgi:hypothetical protein